MTAAGIDDIDREIEERYPYPLVATYQRAMFLAVDATEAHECLLDLFEATLKYLASLTIALYLSDGLREAGIDRALVGNIARPSDGHWVGWLRDILSLYEHDERSLVVHLREFYNKPHAGAIAHAAQGLSRSMDQLHTRVAETTTTQGFFDLLVTYRNWRVHVSRGSTYDREDAVALLEPAMRQLYSEMAFIADFPLIYVRSVAAEFRDDQSARHRFRYVLTQLMGDTPRAVAAQKFSDDLYRERQVYVLEPGDGFVPLVSLHPMLVFARCVRCNRDQAFLLNSSKAHAQEYIAYQCTHHFASSDPASYLERLRLAPNPEVPPSSLPEEADPQRSTSADPAPALRIRGGGQDLVIAGDRQVTIGRDSTADVRIEDIRVSRRHAVVRADVGGWLIEDLQSRNGTFLDGARVDSHRLTDSTSFTLGAIGGPTITCEIVADVAQQTPPTDRHSEVEQSDKEPPSDSGSAETPRVPNPPSPLPNLDLGAIAAAYRIRGPRLRIGRAVDNDLVLADQSVSRHHAEIRWDASTGYSIVDLESHNGVFLNGQQVSSAGLSDFDVVTVGRHRLRLVEGTLEDYITGDVRIAVDSLTVRTSEGRVLLDDVTFVLDKASFLAVVGPSGAGKTTLLNAMTGFRPADSGTVMYGSRDLYSEYDDLRRTIGYVPQDDIIHTQLTIRQALAFTAELRFPSDMPAGERARRVDEVMHELGLSDRADLPINRLSGGQRKRANIGVELLTKPSPLFLDEPTSGLDPGMEKGVMTLLRALADGGRTVIIVTHSQQSLQLCDRVLFLAPGGKPAFYGPPGKALQYFKRQDFADVFTDLEQHPEDNWDERFRSSTEYQTYVDSQVSPEKKGSTPAIARRAPSRPAGAWHRQLGTLLRRYLATIAADRRNLALLIAEAPLISLLMLVSLGHDDFSRPNALAQTAVEIVVLAITLSALLNSIREIVKEFPIYQRERFVGLSIRAYVLSKLGILAPLTVLQSVILVIIGLARQPVSGAGAALPSPGLELIIDVACAGLAALSLGLMVSSTMRSADQAISVLVLLVVAQLVMSIPVLGIGNQPVLAQLSWLSSAKWGVDAVAATVNLNAVQPSLTGPDSSWDHTFGAWGTSIAVLLVLTAVALAATMWLLRRRDPSLLVVQHTPRRRPSRPGT